MPVGDIGDERNPHGNPQYVYTKQVKTPIKHIDKAFLVPGKARRLADILEMYIVHPEYMDLQETTLKTLNYSWGRSFAGKKNSEKFLSKLATSDSNSMTYEQYQAIHDVFQNPDDERWEFMMYFAIIMIQCKTDDDEWVHVRARNTVDDNKWMHCTSIFQWVALYIHNTMGFRL